MHDFWRLLAALLLVFTAAPSAWGQGFPPRDAAARLQAPEGLKATLFASEPMVRQPNFVKCDPRGRLWTIQYLQYPNPAGLKRVSVDRWSRTTYDRVPEPPPRGPIGADVITILEDTDGDGRADRSKNVIEGLNLCTGLEFGHGGLFVLQMPYLLFYPDRNHDDVPDSDPEVLLTGFGMEDAQSVVNHLTWGPDGWLYGVTGSTTTNRVRGLEFQQGVWRYHPRTQAFELFCEGGSNLFGLTFDARGQLFFSSNGGQLCYHGLQGAYYAKSFGKHGGLHNPFAYGWWEEIVKRQPQRGGPTTGGTVYLGGAIPSLEGRFLGGDFLGHTASAWSLIPGGGTFEADRVGTLLDPRDTWAGITDVCFGPAGEIYLSDFYDRRTAHPDPDAEWDRSNGRIYRIAPAEHATMPPADFRQRTTSDLIAALGHSNHWHRRQARLELASRRDPAAVPSLRERLGSSDSSSVLEAFWTLLSSGQLEPRDTLPLFTHSSDDVRFWAVRAAGDEWPEDHEIVTALLAAAARERSPLVLTQFLATARRLSAESSLKVLLATGDQIFPVHHARLRWPAWWAAEAHCIENAPRWVNRAQNGGWETAHGQFLLPLVARRLAAEAQPATYEAAAAILASAPERNRPEVLEAIEQGLAERVRTPVTPTQGDLFTASATKAEARGKNSTARASKVEGPLAVAIHAAWKAVPTDPTLASLALEIGLEGAASSIATAAGDPNIPEEQRLNLLRALDHSGDPDSLKLLLPSLERTNSPRMLVALLQSLGRLEDEALTTRCVALLQHPQQSVRDAARKLLLSRPASTRAVFAQIDAGRLAAADVPLDEVRLVALHGDPVLDAFVRRHWGRVQAGTPEEKLAEMRRLNNDLRAAGGNPQRGRELFKQNCAACHKLFGDGANIGPDLTTTSRSDREFLLRSLVDPSAVVRSQYLTTVIATTGGQVLTGLILERAAGRIVVVDAKGEKQTIPLEAIESMRDSDVSLMPEGLLAKLAPQDVRDLFAWLQSNGDHK